MFTGIIESVGHISAVQMQQGDMQLCVNTAALDMSDVVLGDSIATNGVCLTVIKLTDQGFWADVSVETLVHTYFLSIKVGDKVNLEKALLPSSRMGGHIVTGHVDGIGEIIERSADARSIRFEVKAQTNIAHYIAAKGSITVDGVSLTVNDVKAHSFSLNIVPHTAQNTVLIDYQVGSKVHLEVDIISRYLERLLQKPALAVNEEVAPESGLDMAKLAEFGFLK
jgi:riboflavin synthase